VVKHVESRVLLQLGEATLGRSADCRIVLSSPIASRHHAKLLLAGGALRIVDLGSANGTRVNGELIGREPRPLASGDIISIGSDLLEVVAVPDGMDVPTSTPSADGADIEA